MKKILALMLLILFSAPSIACSPGNLYFEPVFSADQEALSTEEIKRLADWRADQRQRYPNGGTIYVDVQANPATKVPHELAEKRLTNLLRLLRNFDIPQEDIEARVIDRSVDPKHLRSAKLRPQIVQYINTANISIAPRCPHPCCPGPQPIHPN